MFQSVSAFQPTSALLRNVAHNNSWTCFGAAHSLAQVCGTAQQQPTCLDSICSLLHIHRAGLYQLKLRVGTLLEPGCIRQHNRLAYIGVLVASAACCDMYTGYLQLMRWWTEAGRNARKCGFCALVQRLKLALSENVHSLDKELLAAPTSKIHQFKATSGSILVCTLYVSSWALTFPTRAV